MTAGSKDIFPPDKNVTLYNQVLQVINLDKIYLIIMPLSTHIKTNFKYH